jgi:pilus assembly protein CpaE
MRKIKVLIAARSKPAADTIQALLAENPACQTELRLITNGHVDPLYGLESMPDLLLLHHVPGQRELPGLVTGDASDRPPLVIFGPDGGAESVRLAMRAGARDYLTEPVDSAELNGMVAAISRDLAKRRAEETGSLHVFLNGKGGSGATFLATNVAYGLVSSGQGVTLVDLDLQFAGLCRYLDMNPERGIFEALQAVDEMDELSAAAFTCQHSSGLRLLSAKSERLRLNDDISVEKLVKLLKLYRAFNDFVIVDLPRHIDSLSAAVLEQADRILVVMQQTYPHLHDTARLLHILRHEMGVDDSRITVVLNRFIKDAAIEQADIEKALNIKDLIRIPNHYRLSAESVNSGVPLAEVNRNTSVARGLRDLHERIGGTHEADEGFFSRALPGVLLPGLFRR